MKVEVLGTGCAKCDKLYEAAQEAVRRSGKDAAVVKVEDLAEIMKRGVMLTPALAIDGEVKAAGKVLKPDEIARMLG
ncbi:thioredoxin family protein [Deferrisoma camini]|uniref:thioredoxin family protein n=1 Tax=Deferrisoma camini TaxID=1035120 RepID=UPI00046D71B9|nr:thioredoxin family protein [Deferrisoma camini]